MSDFNRYVSGLQGINKKQKDKIDSLETEVDVLRGLLAEKKTTYQEEIDNLREQLREALK